MHPHSPRLAALGASLLLVVLLSSCGGDSPSQPQSENPTAFRIQAPGQVATGVPFSVTVQALGTGGTTLSSFGGTATLSSSAGTVAPATVTLAQGQGTVEVSITGASGTVTLRAGAAGVEGSSDLDVVDTSRLLFGEPTDPAGTAIPAIPFEARAEDYSTTHPLLPGLPLSFNTLLLSFAPATTIGQANAALQGLDAEIVGGITGVAGAASGMLFLRIASTTHEEMEAALATLRANEQVDVAAQDVLLSTTELPKTGTSAVGWTWSSTPESSCLLATNRPCGNWGLEVVRAPQLWNLNDGIKKMLARGETQKPVTGVLDQGFVPIHEDLTFEANQTPGVTNSHGTHVAGIIGARHDNETGIEGINPFARLVVRADTVSVSGTTVVDVRASFGDAFIWNFDQMVRARPDLRVLNISMGYNWWKTPAPLDMNTDTAVHRLAREQGRAVLRMLEGLANSGYTLPVVTLSAGNDSNGPHGTQPARYGSPMTNAALEAPFARNLIVVEALELDPSGLARLWSDSNTGGHISAPGADITSTDIPSNGNYGTESGTSMAAPLVAGLVGYLYTLDSSLPAPTLQSNPALDLLLESSVAVGGGASQRIDAFGAALALDRLNGNDRVLRMLVDVDDGTEDGNRRTDPDADGVDYTETDADGDSGIGDGKVDMRDFRRFRDAHMALAWGGLGVLEFDGSDTHPKKDLNGNGKTESEGDNESLYPRMDFNGDGNIADLRATAYVGGVFRREVTDMEMLEHLFSDPHYDKTDLINLTNSADIAVRPSKLLEMDDVVDIHSSVRRADAEAAEQDPKFRRIHTGNAADGEGLWQVYTVPSFEGGDFSPLDYTVRLVGMDNLGDTIADFEETFTARLGSDHFWDELPVLTCTPVESGFTGWVGETFQDGYGPRAGLTYEIIRSDFNDIATSARAGPNSIGQLRMTYTAMDSIFIIPEDPMVSSGYVRVRIRGRLEQTKGFGIATRAEARVTLAGYEQSWIMADNTGYSAPEFDIDQTSALAHLRFGEWVPLRLWTHHWVSTWAPDVTSSTRAAVSVQFIDLLEYDSFSGVGDTIPIRQICSASGTQYLQEP